MSECDHMKIEQFFDPDKSEVSTIFRYAVRAEPYEGRTAIICEACGQHVTTVCNGHPWRIELEAEA